MNGLIRALVVAAGAFALQAQAAGIPEPATEFDIGEDVRYPKDLKVTPVSDKVPACLKKYAGRWAGQYNGVMNVVITFESLEDPNAIMYVHSVGITPAYNIMRKLVARPATAGKFDAANCTISTSFSPTQTQIFRLTEEGWLENQYEEKGQWKSVGILKRVQDFPGQPSGAAVPAPFSAKESK